MPKLTPETIAAQLTVSERVLLFCVGSGTDWVKAGVTHARAQIMVVKNLLERDHITMRLVLTEHGRAVLSVLLSRRESSCRLPGEAATSRPNDPAP